MYKLKLLRKCSVCLDEKLFCKSLFEKVLDNYLPALIENICGVKILRQDEPYSVVCLECAMALVQADNIKKKFLSSHEILQKQKELIKIEVDIDEEENHDINVEKEEYIYEHKKDHIDEEKEEYIEEYIESDHSEAYYNESQSVKVTRPTKSLYRRVKIGEHAVTINRKNDLHFYCDFCTFESDFVKYFRKHMIEEHNVEKPRIFKCLQCSEAFEYHKTLQAHVAREHDCVPPTLNYLCSECGKAFSTPSDLRRHSFIHNRDKMPFRCEVCSKLFAAHCNLKRHFVAHHSDEKFDCEICGKKFGDFYVLKYHKKHVHKYKV